MVETEGTWDRCEAATTPAWCLDALELDLGLDEAPGRLREPAAADYDGSGGDPQTLLRELSGLETEVVVVGLVDDVVYTINDLAYRDEEDEPLRDDNAK